MTIEEAIKEIEAQKRYSRSASDDEVINFIIYALKLVETGGKLFDWNTEIVKPLYENGVFRESVLNRFMRKE